MTRLAGRTAGPRQALGALCVTEIVSYGVLYYAFPVLAGDISAATRWSRTALTAAFSAASLVTAVSGVGVGRIIDRRGPRLVMTAGSALAVAAVAAIALAPTFAWFTVAWLVAGVAMAGVFYPPAFAALTAWYGPDRVRALTTLTMAAGFASTIFAPLTAGLAGHLSWRGVYLVLAAILAVVTIPAHAAALRLPWAGRAGLARRSAAPGGMRDVLASRVFLILTAAMTIGAFALYAVVINLVPLLTGRGLSAGAAAWALGLGGLGQVAGRLCYPPLAARASPAVRTLAVLAAGAASTALLALVPGPAAALIAGAVLAGAARGMFTLVQATAVSDRWGPDGYASLNGVFTAPMTAAIALAPAAGAVLAASLGGYPVLFAVLAACSLASALLAATTRHPPAGARTPLPAGVPEGPEEG